MLAAVWITTPYYILILMNITIVRTRRSKPGSSPCRKVGREEPGYEAKSGPDEASQSLLDPSTLPQVSVQLSCTRLSD